MLTAFLRAFRTPDLRRKLLFTVFIVAVFRLGSALPTPGVSESAVHACIGLASKNGGEGFALVDLLHGGGGGLREVGVRGVRAAILASALFMMVCRRCAPPC